MKVHQKIISPLDFDAVIFDMDGVVTRTAHVHAAAWKRMFDSYLDQRSRAKGETYAPFSIEKDYTRYVDGKPRYDGVRDFLRSRNIELPQGAPDDPPDRETVCGLGNRKNGYFQKVLEERGAERYESTAVFIRQLHRAGIKTALISASKNAPAVLASAGAMDLFEARVDGLDAEKLGIPGKPAPDVFLAAAKKLGASPRRSVVVEDAQSGVQAGRAGGFGLVIGVDRADQQEELAKYADVVVKDLAEVVVASAESPRTTDQLPSALDHFDKLTGRLAGKQPVVFLDYDGTLTPIVERPELAALSAEMRGTIRELAARCTLAIVSGRDLQDVKRLVGIKGICYAGSHGFDIAGPEGKHLEFVGGKKFLPALDRAEGLLQDQLAEIEGAQVERKKFAIAIHYRRVAQQEWAQVESIVDEILDLFGDLRKTGGKMIFELRPDIDWNKGKALSWLLKQLDLDRPDIVPVYLGDDLTDEDAFAEIEQRGIGILVRNEARPTWASYALENPSEVGMLLQQLKGHLEGRIQA